MARGSFDDTCLLAASIGWGRFGTSVTGWHYDDEVTTSPSHLLVAQNRGCDNGGDSSIPCGQAYGTAEVSGMALLSTLRSHDVGKWHPP